MYLITKVNKFWKIGTILEIGPNPNREEKVTFILLILYKN